VLLRSLSDDDYKKMLSQLPADKSKDPQLESRAAAAFVRRTRHSPRSSTGKRSCSRPRRAADDYSKAYDRVTAKDAAAVGVEPEIAQETGWAIDLLKWLGNAAINYALVGGETYVGRKLKGDRRRPSSTSFLAGLDKDLALADSPEKKAQIHFKAGAAYEALAALPFEAETAAPAGALKKERLDELTDLLQAVSERRI